MIHRNINNIYPPSTRTKSSETTHAENSKGNGPADRTPSHQKCTNALDPLSLPGAIHCLDLVQSFPTNPPSRMNMTVPHPVSCQTYVSSIIPAARSQQDISRNHAIATWTGHQFTGRVCITYRQKDTNNKMVSSKLPCSTVSPHPITTCSIHESTTRTKTERKHNFVHQHSVHMQAL